MLGRAAAALIIAGLARDAGAESPEICQSAPPGATQRLFTMPQGRYAAWWPEFFDDGGRGLYAAVMCSSSIHVVQNGGNCLIDLQRGKILPAPGWFDGQWVKAPGDDPIFTIPNKFSTAKGGALPGLTFFRFDDVVKMGARAPALFRDPAFGNHYHSFGRLEQGVDAEGFAYSINRAMNDKWGVSVRDYKFRFDKEGRVFSIAPASAERNLGNGTGDTEVVKTQATPASDPNPHNSYFDLPMISPDGRLFAVNNRRTMTTQIYEITADDKRLVADLGLETGKLAFAPRAAGSNFLYVAFHVDQIDPAEGDKMSGVHSGMTKDVVAMKLFEKRDASGAAFFEPGQITRVTAANRLGDGNYYPKWINERELVYVESAGDNRQTFVKADLSQFRFQTNLVRRPGADEAGEKAYAAAAALGAFVAKSCVPFASKLTARESALFASNLTRAKCLEIATEWERVKAGALSSSEFFALREPKPPGKQRVGGWGFAESYSARGAQRFEKAPARESVDAIQPADLEAVCGMLE